jgi:hypothetical protein
VVGEACCAFNATEDDYAAVWSLDAKGGGDSLVTAQRGERDALVAGGGWVEVCNGYGGSTDFCVDGSAALLASPRAMQGPFVLHAGCGSGGGGGGARRPLSRCRAADGRQALALLLLSPDFQRR